MPKDETPGHQQSPPELIKGLNLFDAILLGMGTIIGSSIFLTTGDIAQSVPSGFWILAVWICAGLVALAGALTYGELGGLFPRVGGQYAHLKEAYGSLAGFFNTTTSFDSMSFNLATGSMSGYYKVYGYANS